MGCPWQGVGSSVPRCLVPHVFSLSPQEWVSNTTFPRLSLLLPLWARRMEEVGERCSLLLALLWSTPSPSSWCSSLGLASVPYGDFLGLGMSLTYAVLLTKPNKIYRIFEWGESWRDPEVLEDPGDQEGERNSGRDSGVQVKGHRMGFHLPHAPYQGQAHLICLQRW